LSGRGRGCPICCASELRDRGALGHRQLARCTRCGHEFVVRCDDAALASEYRAAYYAAADDPRIAAWAEAHARIWDAVVEQLLVRIPSLTDVLDVGAGSGGFLARLRARCPEVALAAVEPSAAAREALLRRFPGMTFPAECAERLGEVGDRFSVVTMLQTLEHLQDPLAACRGALQCLRPGGILLATVPNRGSLAVWRFGRAADCHANGTHLQFFTARAMRQLLQAAGFVNVERVVEWGGGQHDGRLLQLLQYALRRTGLSTELRFVARRP
jgi:SAM-dependent methyltransferase